MTRLIEILRKEVAQQGVIPFTRFMELALYCPQYGYYESHKSVIGRAGDYYTNISIGRLFGDLLAFQFDTWLEEHTGQSLQILEAGAHGGDLCADILSFLRQKRPSLLETLEYWIIEPSPLRRQPQKARLEKFADHVRWFDTLDSLPGTGVNGIIVSNELLDAMPVRRLEWDSSRHKWFEWGVSTAHERFVWQRMDLNPQEAALELENAQLNLSPELESLLPDGFTIETCDASGKWWTQAAGSLRRGKLLTFDYGYTAEEFLAPTRTQGTLRAYRRHHVSGDLLAQPGEQDLTAHINFSQLQHLGEAMGLRTEGLFPQEQFLTRIASKMWEQKSTLDGWSDEQTRQFQTLVHPEHLGRAFRVLIQSRDANG